jgi:hypothetical protein
MILDIIKKIVWSLCLLYTVNIIISKKGKIIPINIYTIIFIYFYDILAIAVIIYFKYYF